MADLIERKAVIDVLAAMQGRCASKAALIQNSKIWQQIKDLPSAQPELPIKQKCTICPHCDNCDVDDDGTISQPEQRWIPCSETIDIPENEVLCCDGYGNEMIGYLAYTDEQWLCESDAEMMYDPIAWMEKPKPWKEEKDDETRSD